MPWSFGHRERFSCSGVRAAGWVAGWLVVAAGLAGGKPLAGQTPDSEAPAALLSLPRGTLSGRLVEGPAPADGVSSTIRWESPAFATPFEFPIGCVGGIAFERLPESPIPAAAGPWQLELANGDRVVGRLESIDERSVVMSMGSAAAPNGIVVQRASVRRIATGAGRSHFVWNGGLDQCQTSAESHWRSHAGGLASTTPGAMIRFQAGDGDRMRYDLTLAWERPPHLRLGFGELRAATDNGGSEASLDPAYRIELIDGELIVVRDEATPDGTGRAALQPCGALPGQGLSLSVFIDRKAGRIVVARAGEREPLADLAIEPIAIEPVPEGPMMPPGLSPRTAAPEQRGQGLQIDDRSGATVVESVRIGPWNGSLAGADEDQPAAVELIDGDVIAGRVTGISGDPLGLMIDVEGAGGSSSRSVPVDTVAAIRFTGPASPSAETREGDRPRVRVSDRYGSSLTGEFLGVADGKVTVLHAAVDAPVALPIGLLARLASMTTEPEQPALPGRIGRLDLGDSRHEGCLVPIPGRAAAADGGAIGWLPRGSLIAAPFLPAADGGTVPATVRYAVGIDDATAAEATDDQNGWVGATIVAVDGKAMIQEVIPGGPLSRIPLQTPAHLRAVAPRGDGVFVPTAGLPIDDVMFLVQGRAGADVQLRVAQGLLGISTDIPLVRDLHPVWGKNRQRLLDVLKAQQRLLARAANKGAPPDADRYRSEVILETGELVAGSVESIGDSGLRLVREGAEPVTIPAEAVKAVELVPREAATITPEKFRSLTTLPRAQRHLPPTHLVRSLSGDYLRGRLVGMDGETLRMTVDADPRGKPLTIPRREVARVIWLHPESLDDAWTRPATDPPAGLPVEAVTESAGRLRMMVTGIEGDVLVGAHPILGASRIDLDAIDRLLLGGVLEESPRRLPYAQWQLQPAAEPRNLPSKRPPKP